MDYFPLFLKIKSQHCLVVGAGKVAQRKIVLLARAGAAITVIAKDISPSIQEMADADDLIIKHRAFKEEDVNGFCLVVSATDDMATNQRVYQSAMQLNIPVNVVDNPALCSFIFPAIIDRSPIIAAVSSGGVSPVLSRLLRVKIEGIIPPAFGRLAKLAEKFRPVVKQYIKEPSQRRIFWESILQGKISELVFAGRESEAESQLEALIHTTKNESKMGEVYLVGAGPGDPDLLTFRALRLMQQADVVVYDRLVSAEILDLTRRDAEKIYVGKQRKNHSLPQDSINQLLISLAKEGKRVVRLKGGDPFIFGRGGEEIETLLAENILFQVVPGITAASGCATYAGIPLTHRDHAQACVFVTGHLKDGSCDLNWQQLTTKNQTVVFYMGLSSLTQICQSLIDHGSSEDHPIAIIQQGTTVNQRVITGTLKTLPQLVKGKNIKAPTLIIVGTVVTLHSQLNWFKVN